MVFPTCVGVFPVSAPQLRTGSRLPHVRGGVSTMNNNSLPDLMSSPRAWGCFHDIGISWIGVDVFPTCVGVFPTFTWSFGGAECLPHVRGGVSTHRNALLRFLGSSPRAWGCFSTLPQFRGITSVFPTCVGVFPYYIVSKMLAQGLPHVRGGVSGEGEGQGQPAASSPRAWGCFRFFGTEEDAKRGLPHVRGGVSGVPHPFQSRF